MLKASVSNIELFRTWREDEELDLNWILQRILEPTQTEAMKAGEAFHKALQHASLGDLNSIEADGYRFDFDCECEVELSPALELSVSGFYGELMVRGRVDSTTGKLVADYKTTSQFDADRLMSGYQWRYYLDLCEADIFRWEVFVLRETDEPKHYMVSDFHRLEQRRYPNLRADCEKLAAEYLAFAKEHIEPRRETSLLQQQLEMSLAAKSQRHLLGGQGQR